MSKETAFCERHGPFDAMYPGCPYCAVERGEIPRKAKTGPLTLPDDEPSTMDGEPIIARMQEMQAWRGHDNDAFGTGGGRLEAPTQDDLPAFNPAALPPADETPTLMDGPPVPGDVPAASADAATDVDRSPGPLPLLFVARPLERRGEVFMFRPGATIGRGHCDLRFDDRKMSRRHASIDLISDPDTGALTMTVFDYGSSNGTFVNGQRVDGRAELVENDELRIGLHLFVVKLIG